MLISLGSAVIAHPKFNWRIALYPWATEDLSTLATACKQDWPFCQTNTLVLQKVNAMYNSTSNSIRNSLFRVALICVGWLMISDFYSLSVASRSYSVLSVTLSICCSTLLQQTLHAQSQWWADILHLHSKGVQDSKLAKRGSNSDNGQHNKDLLPVWLQCTRMWLTECAQSQAHVSLALQLLVVAKSLSKFTACWLPVMYILMCQQLQVNSSVSITDTAA